MSQQQGLSLEPEWNFQRHIQLMAARSGSDHLYPRPDLNNLSDFLRSAGNLFGDSASSQLTALNVPWDIKDSFVVVHDLETGDCRPFGTTKKDARTFRAHDSLTRPSLVFLRGYASPHWLNLIGQKHGVSPELYQRHLDYDAFSSSGRDLHLAGLAVFLYPSYEPEDLQSARQQQLEDMKAYFRHLRGQANLVHSVVRRCLLLSKQVYVVEQRASVEVASCGDSWRAIIWLDNGRDLSESVAGPWLPYQARLA
ncbi:hypothetical protein VFPPC_05346 [Pochonia chlamydosporia 170]|uniref:Uncharacterized protein n=1 Tax=Pochonia chlamydosporia 170 TaxID=1380566 RepID=A0A179FUG8_METCM|nr:hypothetical protein VFPPC_05346 [Pochonia chlamydosporia 170]OAQ69254.2 hypothetical protein VFPPC_05346 [Pochonia chlamydosporia 170]